MNILDRITEFRVARNWSEYQLAEKSGLTQSTISSWYRKNILPTIPSLEKICMAFNISLSQFFMEEATTIMPLTNLQVEMVEQFNKLSLKQKEHLLEFLKSM